VKILYVTNSSERTKKFQIQTIIYEQDGEKFVKKSALCKEAILHIRRMKENYIKLSSKIINPNVKLAKIVDQSEDSVTFEFIEGKSLKKKISEVINDKNQVEKFINEYIKLIRESFQITVFNLQNINNDFKKIFGDNDYIYSDELCFDGVSNIDLIFSNIIQQEDKFYIIDYEWGFEFNIPINFIIFRSFEFFKYLDKEKNVVDYDEILFQYKLVKFETKFLHMEESFQKHVFGGAIELNKYTKQRISFNQMITESKQLILKKDQMIIESEQLVLKKDQIIIESEQLVLKKDYLLKEALDMAESLRIKNRLKRIFKRISFNLWRK